jgi:hypothetical protein
MGTLDSGVIYARFHHATQNCVSFKTYKLFLSGIFPQYFQPGLTQETKEGKAVDERGQLHLSCLWLQRSVLLDWKQQTWGQLLLPTVCPRIVVHSLVTFKTPTRGQGLVRFKIAAQRHLASFTCSPGQFTHLSCFGLYWGLNSGSTP